MGSDFLPGFCFSICTFNSMVTLKDLENDATSLSVRLLSEAKFSSIVTDFMLSTQSYNYDEGFLRRLPLT
jgi:hypothetical protein